MKTRQHHRLRSQSYTNTPHIQIHTFLEYIFDHKEYAKSHYLMEEFAPGDRDRSVTDQAGYQNETEAYKETKNLKQTKKHHSKKTPKPPNPKTTKPNLAISMNDAFAGSYVSTNQPFQTFCRSSFVQAHYCGSVNMVIVQPVHSHQTNHFQAKSGCL